MAGEKLLSETACKAAKPTTNMYYLNDGAGLRLRCRPNGSRTWIYRYRINGHEKSIGLGSYPQVSLRIARIKAAESNALVIEGKNPSLEKKLKRAKSATQEAQTFGSVARDWMSHNKPDWSEKHFARNEGLIRLYLMPHLGLLPIQEIESSYLFATLKPVYDKGTKESARRARGIAAQIFDYGIDTYRCTHNPAKSMRSNKHFKKPIVNHLKALPKGDVPLLIAELRKTGIEQRLKPQTVCALLLMLYTGHRDHAVRGAKWKEFNLASSTWIVPGERMKGTKETKRTRAPHEVPLPSQAVEALLELKSISFSGPNGFVFSANTKTGYMAENTLRLALHRLGFKVTAHGIRSLITDVLNEQGFNADAIERQLDHKERNEVRRAYLRSNFEKERHAMMQFFADWCDGNEQSPSNILRFTGHASR